MPLTDRLRVDSQDLSDLRVLELLHVNHTQQLSLLVRKLLEQPVHFLVDRILQDVILIHLRRLRSVIQVLGLSAAVLAEIVDQAVSRDRAQPCAGRGLGRIEPVIMGHGPHEYLADKILRVLPVHHLHINIVVHIRIFALIDFREIRLISVYTHFYRLLPLFVKKYPHFCMPSSGLHRRQLRTALHILTPPR